MCRLAGKVPRVNDPTTLESWLALLAAGVLSVGTIAFAARRTKYRVPLVASYLLHLAIGIAVFTMLGLYAPDAYGYDREAREFVMVWTGEARALPIISTGKEGFTLLLAAVYYAVGHQPFIGVLINVTASALIVPIVAATAERLGAPGNRAAWMAALFPSLLFWGSLGLRESLVWLCIAVVGWSLVGLASNPRGSDIAWMIAGLLGLLWVRGTAAILIGAGGVMALMAVRRKAGGLVIALGLAALVVASPIAQRTVQITSAYEVQNINKSRAALTGLADSGFATASYEGRLGIVRALPAMLPRAVAGPFPWEWPRLNPLFALDAIAWLVLLWWTWRGRRALGGQKSFILIGPAIVIVLALAVTSGNYGTLQRLRLLSAILIIPVAAASNLPRSEKQKVSTRAEQILARQSGERDTKSAPSRNEQLSRTCEDQAQAEPLAASPILSD